MKLIYKIDYKVYNFIKNIRYRKYKKCTIPCSTYNHKRRVLEWVYFDKKDNNYVIMDDLYYSLMSLRGFGITYFFVTKAVKYYEGKGYVSKLIEASVHSFDEVVRYLYCNPESFSIPKKFLSYYTKQQLDYLKTAQKYFLSLGLKDIDYLQDSNIINKRYEI